MLIKRTMLKALLPVVTAEDTRYFLSAIQIRPDGKAVATDGHVLLIAEDGHPEQDAEFPVKGMPEFQGSPIGPVCVPKAVVEKILGAMPKKCTIPIMGYAQIGTIEGGAVIRSTDFTAACVIDLPTDDQQKFPDYARVVPAVDRPELKITLAVNVLKSLIKAVEAIQDGRKSSEGGTITFGLPTAPGCQGKVPLDHGFRFNGAAMCIDDDTLCDHEGCGRRKAAHDGGPDGHVIAAASILAKSGGITITGAAMPCRM